MVPLQGERNNPEPKAVHTPHPDDPRFKPKAFKSDSKSDSKFDSKSDSRSDSKADFKSSDSSKASSHPLDSPILPHNIYAALTKAAPKHFKRKPGWRTECPEPNVRQGSDHAPHPVAHLTASPRIASHRIAILLSPSEEYTPRNPRRSDH
eukprot:7542881-Pyramimonas_sp.AAC.1